MSTISQIVAALKNTFDTVPAIDQLSTDEYLPPINTQNTALIIPAFGMQSEIGEMTFGGGAMYQTHRIRCELWVKHTGNNADLTQRTRAVTTDAIRALTDDSDLGGVVEYIGWYGGRTADRSISVDVADNLVTIGSASYLISTLIVPVTDFSLP